ncbi:hypothetical protein V8F20_004230 [Naviculisporaceae sp. PSN 640]
MKFSVISTIALIGAAQAAPADLPADMSPRAALNEAEIFAFAPPASCSILGCIGVIGAAVCIVDAIDDDDYGAILKCAKKKDLCSCAGCFNALGGFLDKWGIC